VGFVLILAGSVLATRRATTAVPADQREEVCVVAEP